MSEDEMYVGKIKEIDLQGKSIEEMSKHLIKESDDELETEYYNDYTQMLREAYHDTYIIVEDKIYEILEKVNDNPEYVEQATKNDNGTITYVLSYYNGGTCFQEALERAVKKMNKDED